MKNGETCSYKTLHGSLIFHVTLSMFIQYCRRGFSLHGGIRKSKNRLIDTEYNENKKCINISSWSLTSTLLYFFSFCFKDSYYAYPDPAMIKESKGINQSCVLCTEEV